MQALDSTFILFGANGNLSRIKLIPGLFRLDQAGRLSDKMAILSVGRGQVSREDWQAEIKGMLNAKFPKGYDQTVFKRFIARNHYHGNPPNDPNAFQRLKELLSDGATFPQNMAFFLSVRPVDFSIIVDQLAEVDLVNEATGWRRVVIEKPFGTNLESAKALQAAITKHLKESQIYRIDHYLGKAALQNIMLTRFANTVLEPIWNSKYIDHVQITNNETLGVGERTQFYDSTGALRDMIQSHLLQMMALVAMEQSKDLSPESIRDEKIKVLQAIRPIPLNDLAHYAFRGQYGKGTLAGEKIPGYLEELGYDSVVETYAALKLFIDNPRWKGVPFYVRTAKRLHEGSTAVSIRFKKAPMQPGNSGQQQNWLMLGIQPRECIKMEIQSKVPGLDIATRTISLDAPQRQEGDESIDAYESLLLNLIEGDQSHYLHIREVEAAWSLVDPVIETWAKDKSPVHTYPAGSHDPEASRVIFESEDQFWRYSIEIDGEKHGQ